MLYINRFVNFNLVIASLYILIFFYSCGYISKIFMLLKRKTYNILTTRCQYLNLIYKHAITTIACIIKPLQYKKNILKNMLQNTIAYLKRFFF
jgi:hypothetical protein